MSHVLWQEQLTADLQTPAQNLEDSIYNDLVENTKKIPLSNQEITIPDPRAFRSMSRAALLLAHICKKSDLFLQDYKNEKSFQVGIYCAVENGPLDATSTQQIMQRPASEFAEAYRKLRNPKMYLKQLPNLAPAQMGIFMGIFGPMNVYTHSTMGALHALEQAEWDLQNGIVQRALVCAAYAFDDFLVVKRTRQQDTRCLVEGVAAMLLAPSADSTEWRKLLETKKLENKSSQHYFGIADQLIQLTRGL